MDPSSTNRQRLRSMPQSKSFVRLLRAFIRQIINRPSIQAQASNSIKFPSGYAFPYSYSSQPEDDCLSAALVCGTFVCHASCLASPKKRSLNEVDAHCKPVDVFVIDWDVEILEIKETILYLLRPPFYHGIIIVRFIRAMRVGLEELAHEPGGVKERIPIKL
mmetsp:Transcript_30395/g.47621  ORF Transcript_30395/g.47621 Transcript_30395/m.47621 type:complete len:162 (+) Transcript_30395:480-965(+)